MGAVESELPFEKGPTAQRDQFESLIEEALGCDHGWWNARRRSGKSVGDPVLR
jgi:hypothetical protein